MTKIENTPGNRPAHPSANQNADQSINNSAIQSSGGLAHAREVAEYWKERRRYLKAIRKTPAVRHRYWRAMGIYLLRRIIWSFGFFPVFFAFWIPLVLAQFNPVVLANNAIPLLQEFTAGNPELQANTISALVIAWMSIGGFFLVFDFVLSPFRSPYEYEADVYMQAWERDSTLPSPATGSLSDPSPKPNSVEAP